MKQTKTLLLSLVLIMSSFIYAQRSTTVENIVGNPANYDRESVEVEGTVRQLIQSSTSTKYYILGGDYGGVIKVNTADPPPETYKKYSVIGIVYLERTTNEPFISEKSRELLEELKAPIATAADSITDASFIAKWTASPKTAGYYLDVATDGSFENMVAGYSNKDVGNVITYSIRGLSGGTKYYYRVRAYDFNGMISTNSNTQQLTTAGSWFLQFLKDYYIIIALGVILIILVVVLIYINRKRSVRAYTPPAYEAPSYEGATPGAAAISQETVPVFSSDEDFKSIRIATSSQETLKLLPGELVISNGEDKGKSFRITGYPTAEGAIVTIGREEVKGDRASSHIQLKQRTIGRKQAELIYKDGKLYIKNLGEENYTQVDGVELKPGEKAELKPGSTIRTGEVEFQYKV